MIEVNAAIDILEAALAGLRNMEKNGRKFILVRSWHDLILVALTWHPEDEVYKYQLDQYVDFFEEHKP